MIQNPRHNWQPKLINGQTMELMGILVQNYLPLDIFGKYCSIVFLLPNVNCSFAGNLVFLSGSFKGFHFALGVLKFTIMCLG